jgi:hypothetical protein
VLGGPGAGLRRERPERGQTGVDRAVEATLPFDHDGAGRIELADDAAITRAEVGSGIRGQLDEGADTHAGGDARGEQAGTSCVHAPNETAKALRGRPPIGEYCLTRTGRRHNRCAERVRAPAAHSEFDG